MITASPGPMSVRGMPAAPAAGPEGASSGGDSPPWADASPAPNAGFPSDAQLEWAVLVDRIDDAGQLRVAQMMRDRVRVIELAPERLIFRQTNKTHAKSASRCPAVIQMESRYFVVKCPFDLHIGFGRDEKGKAHLINRAGVGSAIRSNKISEVLVLVNVRSGSRTWAVPGALAGEWVDVLVGGELDLA